MAGPAKPRSRRKRPAPVAGRGPAVTLASKRKAATKRPAAATRQPGTKPPAAKRKRSAPPPQAREFTHRPRTPAAQQGSPRASRDERALRDRLALRETELAVIDAIHQAVASKFDFQGIVDLAGDRLRDIFASDAISIRWYDPKNDLILYLYEYEHGVRLHAAPRPPSESAMWMRLRETRKPVVRGTRAELETLGLRTMPGTDTSHSALGVPILAADRMLGIIVLNDHAREHAYGEAEIRLLTTVAGSMGVALENARLFDETQRLL